MSFAKIITEIHRIKKLVVETKYIVHNKNNDEMIAFSTSRKGVPNNIFISRELKSLKDSDEFLYYKINSSNVNKLGRNYDIEDQKEYISLLQDLRFLNTADAAKAIGVMNELKRNPLTSPLVIKSDAINRDKLYKVLTTDLKLSLSVVNTYFGQFDEDNAFDLTYKGTKIDFPSNARESNKQVMMGLVHELYKDLSKHGAKGAFNTHIRFVKLSGRVLGYYDLVNKDIKISYNAKQSKRLLHTLYHEFGHKWFYENIISKHKEIKDKYNSLMKGGQGFDDKKIIKKYEDLNDKFFQVAKVGDVIEHIGRKRKYKGRWVIDKINKPNILLVPEDPQQTRIKNMMAEPTALIGNNEWIAPDNKKLQKIMGVREVAPQESDKSTKEWFPTKYSEKNVSEWYAELFAFYILDKLKGEPAKFIKSTLK